MIDKTTYILRLTFLFALAFLIMFSYGIARPAIESLFLKAHSSQALPDVWIFMSLTMIVIVSIYNKFLPKVRLIKLYVIISALSTLILFLMILAAKINFPGIYYLLYIWKDIYVILLVELFYSYTNSVFPIQQARWFYGFFGAVAAAGAVVANFAVGPIAKNMGSLNSLWFVVVTLIVTALICIPFSIYCDIDMPESFKKKKTNIFEALKVVNKSSYLLLFLFLICVVQITITLVDFDFNTIIEKLYPVVDERTNIMGNIYGIVNSATFVLHALTGVILRLTGIPLILIGVPLLLASSLAFFIALPGFLTVAILKITSKAFDYTIFRSARECLYIPLNYEERTQGKSIVDMIVYRMGKVGASLFVKLFIMFNAAAFVSWVTLVFIGIWITLTTFIVKRFRKIVSRDDEMNLS
jgi:ATP:ADP antiporter, AAA family